MPLSGKSRSLGYNVHRSHAPFKTAGMDIRNLPKLLVMSLTLISLCAAGQDGQQDDQSSGVTVNDYGTDRMARITEETIEDKAQIIPSGWLDDYDYLSDLSGYLNGKYQDALNSSKNTYVYLYADWYENCRTFRKSVERDDYAELFLNNEMILLDYNFFRNRFNTQTRNLPLILKVNKDGILGPESIHLVSNPSDHPKKAYYKLKKFFGSNDKAR
jgi:hypothetical protein